jgi:cadmium resistance protein CadD (predicted permease)
MIPLVQILGGVFGGAVVFASTNVDGFLLLTALYASREMSGWSIAAGQSLAMAVLVLVSALAAFASRAVPIYWTSLLGLAPLALGVRVLLRRKTAPQPLAQFTLPFWSEPPGRNARHEVLIVAGLALADGGDNLGAYIPLFTASAKAIPVYAAVFAAMTALWCWAARRIADNSWMRVRAAAWGAALLPIVLIALGVWVLARPFIT